MAISPAEFPKPQRIGNKDVFVVMHKTRSCCPERRHTAPFKSSSYIAES